MKINGDFVIRDIAGSAVVVPVGASAVDFGGMLSLNETGAFLFNALLQGATEQQLVSDLTDEYAVSQKKAAEDVALFIKKLKDAGILE